MGRRRKGGGAWARGPLLWVRRDESVGRTVLVMRRRLGNAVKRNRLKRQLRCLCSELELEGLGLVVLPQEDAVGAPYGALRSELSELARRVQ